MSLLSPIIAHWANEMILQETCTANQARNLLHYIQLQNQDLATRQQNITPIDPIEAAWYPSPSVADLSKM